MDANQFYSVHNRIIEVSAETKRKPAYLKVVIPNELAEKLLKQPILKGSQPIKGLALTWHDTDKEKR